MIWQIGRDGPQPNKPISTADTAVAKHFYGRLETGVEDALGEKLENPVCRALQAIDSNASPMDVSGVLNPFVYLLAFRTKSWRSQFSGTAASMTSAVFASLESDAAVNALLRDTEGNFDRHFADAVEGMPPLIADLVRRNPRLRKAVRQALPALLQQGDLLRELLAQLRSSIDVEALVQKATNDGQVESLARVLGELEEFDQFEPPVWKALRQDPDTFILGDSCVTAVDETGEIGPFARFGRSWAEVYLPISHEIAVVAQRIDRPLQLNAHQLNLASAKLSVEFIYARKYDTRIEALSSEIGTSAALLDDDEIDRLVEECWNAHGQ